MHSRPRLVDEPAERARAPEPASPSSPAVLDLQRSAGNAAVTRLLAREPAAFSPFRPGAGPGMGGPLDLTKGVGADYEAASDAVRAWFAKLAVGARSQEAGILQSLPELVASAGQLPFARPDGGQGLVKDTVKPNEIELGLREQAKHEGVLLLEHRDASDLAGVQSETAAILANLGAIPTQITLGGDGAKLVASISGKVTGEAKVGGAKVEGEVSGDGANATVTVPGGGKVEGHVTGDGAGGSVSAPGGSAGIDVTGKGIKAKVKAGDLITVDASITREATGVVGWQAEISIGTIGKLIMPEDVAKVFKGAQETFTKSAGELARDHSDPAKVKEHAGALAGAVSDVLEKAKKSAEQNKPGWRIGAELKGDSAGGLSAGVTFTWVF